MTQEDPQDGHVQAEARRWIKLSAALERVFILERAQLGASNGGRGEEFRTPEQDELVQVLVRIPGVKVYEERKNRRGAKRPPGSTSSAGEYLGPADPPSKIVRSRKALRRGDAALGTAHLVLMQLMTAGDVPARGCVRMQRSGSVGAFTQEPVPIANNTWDGDPPGSASIPDYAHNRLQCYGDVGADCSFEYKEIEVDAELLEAELLKMSVTLPASKGVLRPLRNGMPPQLEIEFGGVRTTLKMTKGVAALVLLISNPGQSIAWLDLDAETDYVLRTGKVRSISNASPEFRQLTPLPEYGNGTNDDLQLSFDDFSHTISNGASAPVFDANECNWIADMMRKRSASKGAFSKERQASLEEEERQVKKWIADLRIKSQRTTSPSHKQREALYHAMELALAKLPAACAPLAAHLGTLHNGDQKTLQNSDRRALSTDAYGIRYAPRGGDVAWETKGF